MRAEHGPMSSVPRAVCGQKEHLGMGTWAIANGRKIHSSLTLRHCKHWKKRNLCCACFFFGIQRLKPYLSFCQEPRSMYTDGAIYYVLYCDQVLKYLQEITRKPEKLCCLLWLQLSKTIIEWAQYIKHSMLHSRLTEKGCHLFSESLQKTYLPHSYCMHPISWCQSSHTWPLQTYEKGIFK